MHSPVFREPYVILLGDVGVGKSKILETLTRFTGLSSPSSKSFTRNSTLYPIIDGGFRVCDTPGSNSLIDKFEHNLAIAIAMNFAPVTSVCIVVKAEQRLANVTEKLSKYASIFLPEHIPLELISICVTHMDISTRKWTKEDFINCLEDYFGISSCVFFGLNTSRQKLRNDFLTELKDKKPIKLDITGELFLRMFQIGKTNFKIIRCIRSEATRFSHAVTTFYAYRDDISDKSVKRDITFEFQAWMQEEIIKTQQKFAQDNNFDFIANIANEAGHVASLTSKLKSLLRNVRIDALRYQDEVKSDFRKCPHCGEVWALVEACPSTTCGARPSAGLQFDVYGHKYGMMEFFSFEWAGLSLTIKKNLSKVWNDGKSIQSRSGGTAFGCGKAINWNQMAPVITEWEIPEVSTIDIKPVEIRVQKNFDKEFEEKAAAIKVSLKF